jgi:hypothetical protein
MSTTNYISAFMDEEAKEPLRVNAVDGANTVTIMVNNHCTLFIDSVASLGLLEDALKRCRTEFAKKAEATPTIDEIASAAPVPVAHQDAPPF